MMGNKKLETDGKIDHATGSARTTVGNAKDAVRDAASGRAK
jgi:uncharacterized protein YjbJ (UPF0337 family)